MFWLNGMAGTGKSTIARTLAAEFDHKKQLSASFFFKNGEGDRGKASSLFTTIATQLVKTIPEIRPFVRKALEDDPNIADKALRLQFEQLILCPLQEIKNPVRSVMLIVIDALDECDNEAHIKTIVELCSQLQRVPIISVRTLVTSRPELPPRLVFRRTSDSSHQDFILHEIDKAVIGHDIALFLEYKFEQIRTEARIIAEWPGKDNIEVLAEMAVPLFIFAATVCRFIGHSYHDPRKPLNYVLEYQNTPGLDQMGKTYKSILDRILDGEGEEGEVQRVLLIQNFRNVVGPIVVLADNLSVNSLASLLQMDAWDIHSQLETLHSVLNITTDPDRPVRPLHSSFLNYLLDGKRQGENQYWIDETSTHKHLAYKCIHLLQNSQSLKQDICDLRKPGSYRSEVEQSTVERHISPDLQYACCYWVHHLDKGQCKISDQDECHPFLQESFLYLLVALSLIGRCSTAVAMITKLQTLLDQNASLELADLLKDTWRFVQANHAVADIAPLQLYYSSLIFTTQRSKMRSKFRPPKWLARPIITENWWDATLQTPEGHSDWVTSVAFSPDGEKLASGSGDLHHQNLGCRCSCRRNLGTDTEGPHELGHLSNVFA